ncbi:MAG TPA: FAD-dependent oxidoreductase [Kiritimatiellia bacterium]|nr:FAD-dependent oxidoreductase [Kiritimatiellia bacterium]HRU69453.1 FAD-dependent oxidoreductase [Kiritimatiellia bacterium]
MRELLLAAKHYGVAHDAGGGLRMQSHMRMLGFAAAAAAKVSIDRRCELKDVPYTALRALLTEKGTFADGPHAVNVYDNWKTGGRAGRTCGRKGGRKDGGSAEHRQSLASVGRTCVKAAESDKCLMSN